MRSPWSLRPSTLTENAIEALEMHLIIDYQAKRQPSQEYKLFLRPFRLRLFLAALLAVVLAMLCCVFRVSKRCALCALGSPTRVGSMDAVECI